MSITITITDPTPEQIAALFGTQASAKPQTGNAAKKDTKASSPPDDTQGSGDQTSDSGQTATTAASPSDDVPSQEEVTAAAKALVAANSREALAELLGQFDAKNLSAILADKRADFIHQCKEKTK